MNPIITDALEYYYSLTSNSKKIFDLLSNNKIDFQHITKATNDKTSAQIIINNLQYKLSYQTLGYYNSDTNIWTWGWAYNYSRDIDIKTCLKLFNYGLSLNIRRDDMELKTKIITSQIYIDEDFELEIFFALMSYLTQNVYIYNFPLPNKKDRICIQLNLNELKNYNLL